MDDWKGKQSHALVSRMSVALINAFSTYPLHRNPWQIFSNQLLPLFLRSITLTHHEVAKAEVVDSNSNAGVSSSHILLFCQPYASWFFYECSTTIARYRYIYESGLLISMPCHLH